MFTKLPQHKDTSKSKQMKKNAESNPFIAYLRVNVPTVNGMIPWISSKYIGHHVWLTIRWNGKYMLTHKSTHKNWEGFVAGVHVTKFVVWLNGKCCEHLKAHGLIDDNPIKVFNPKDVVEFNEEFDKSQAAKKELTEGWTPTKSQWEDLWKQKAK